MEPSENVEVKKKYPSMLEDILKDNSPVMYEKYLLIKDQAKDILPKIRVIFSGYTNHDIKHAENVVWNLNEIIPDSIKSKLNDEEIFCLLCAAWLHDIGMVPNQSEIEEFKNAGSKEEKEQIMNKIRDIHHIRSYTFLKEDDSFKLERHEKSIIADISRSHTKIDIHTELKEGYRISSRREVRLQFLATCLRIADECDETDHRISKHDLEENRTSSAFVHHYKKLELVDDIYLSKDNTKIIIRGQITSKTDLNTIKRLQFKIQEEINEFKDILNKNGFLLESVELDFDEELLIEKEIILLLSDMKPRSLDEILELDIDSTDIKRCVDNLKAKDIINKDSDKLILSEKVTSFIKIFELFYGDKTLKKLIEYKYSKKVIEEKFFNYLMEIYNIPFMEQNEINRRVTILKYSPKAIYLSLHGMDMFELSYSLIQGKCLLDQLILVGFHYDMYSHPMNIENIQKFIDDYIKPLCNQICECVPKLTTLYNQIQPEVKGKYSEDFFELFSEEKKDKYKLNPGKTSGNTNKDIDSTKSSILREDTNGKKKFSFQVNSKKGEPNIIDLLIASQETGIPIEIGGNRISNWKFDKDLLPDQIKKITGIGILPGLILSLSLKVINSKICYDNLLFRLIEKNKTIKFSTEDRNLPYIFGFSFESGSNNQPHFMENIKFNFEIKPPADAEQLFKWEEFLRILNDKKSISLIETKTKNVIIEGKNINENLEVGNDNWYQILRKLSNIQKKTDQKIIIPKDYDLKNSDFKNIFHTYELLDSGKTEIDVDNVAFSLKVININEMIQIKRKRKRSPFRVTIPNYQMEIINKMISLGPVNLSSPNYEIFDENKLKSELKELDDMDSIEVKVIPENEKIKLTRI